MAPQLRTAFRHLVIQTPRIGVNMDLSSIEEMLTVKEKGATQLHFLEETLSIGRMETLYLDYSDIDGSALFCSVHKSSGPRFST